MDYISLAVEFINNSQKFRSRSHQKKVDETMQGEAFTLLYILKGGNKVLPSQLSREMNITTARVAAILKRLEGKGLITRQADKSDKRRVLVELTLEGRNLAKEQEQMIIEMTVRMLKLLGEKDAKELVRIMGKLAKLAPKIILNEGV